MRALWYIVRDIPRRRTAWWALAACAAVTGCATVPSGYGAVVTSPWSGVRAEPLGEGVSLVWPRAQVDVLDLRAPEPREDLRGLAADGAPVQANASVVTWHIVPTELVAFDRQVGPEPYARIVRPIVESAVRRVVARYTGFELMDTRHIAEIQRAITDLAAAETRPLHIVVDGVLIRSIVITSGPLYAKILETSRAEQDSLKMVHEIVISRARGEDLRERGRAQAAANALVAPTLTPEALTHAGTLAWTELLTAPRTKVLVAPDDRPALEIAP